MSDDINYENLKVAVVEYDKAAAAVDQFNNTYYRPYQVEPPANAAERRAAEQLMDAARVVENAQRQCLARLILAARKCVSCQ